MTRADQLLAQKVIAFGAVLITLIVTPWANADPINLPKLLTLAVVATSATFLCINLILQKAKQSKVLTSFLAVYIFWLMCIFTFAPGWKVQQLFGTEGRNTGLVAYLFFIALFISTATVSNKDMVDRLWFALTFVGVMSLVYGFLQRVGLDPAPWINPDNPIIGFLGNSNFQSSLLGVCISLLLPSIFQKSINKTQRGFFAIFAFSALSLIIMSDAIQGVFVAVAGLSSMVLIKTYKSNYHQLLPYLITIITSGAILVFLGLINTGPFAKFLFVKSVMARFEYWQAAIKMTSDYPLFGVGLDSFGDWYRRSRTSDAMLRRDVIADSAHNVFLDQFANGGVVLGGLYLVLHFIVLRSIFRIVKRGSLDAKTIGFICAWIGYVSQSLISISQIGLAVWGWIISGLIVGVDANHKLSYSEEKLRNKKKIGEKASARSAILLPLGVAIGFISTSAPLTSDISYYKALNSRSASQLVAATEKFGASSKMQLRIAAILSQNNLYSESLTVSTRLVSRNSQEFNAWSLIYSNPKASSDLKVTARNNMRRLEPNKKDF
jgi:O-antigen ligase